jgi:hypothetical protein
MKWSFEIKARSPITYQHSRQSPPPPALSKPMLRPALDRQKKRQ